MGIFKLDLMTLLVLFVVLGVIVTTMVTGSNGGQQAGVDRVNPAVSVNTNAAGTANNVNNMSGVNKWGFAGSSNYSSDTGLAGVKFGGRTWN